MPCPHGSNSDPDTCSQCRGAVPRRITVENQGLMLDGKPWKREQPKFNYNPQTGKRRCSGCGKPGHYITKCPEAAPQEQMSDE